MKFLPEVLLDLSQISPCVHFVGLNILNFFLEILLTFFVTFDILDQIGIIWIFDDDAGDVLWGFDFSDVLLFLESLSDDVGDGHVVFCFELSEL